MNKQPTNDAPIKDGEIIIIDTEAGARYYKVGTGFIESPENEVN